MTAGLRALSMRSLLIAYFQPRSLELYHFLGAKEILDEANFLFTVRKHMGGSEPDKILQMMPWVDPTPSCPWVGNRRTIAPYYALPQFYPVKLSMLRMGQAHAESILRSHLEKFDCQVELATKLTSFEQNVNHVMADLVMTRDGQEITETVNFDWIIGADGARS
jgi:2-polyprenyl-6-methoxyphenol hydroxylase-like FAD-dependent oxidoreductase